MSEPPALGPDPDRLLLGDFVVSATAAEAAAFCAVTGARPHDDLLALTFPMRWLVTPSIRAALLDAVGDPAFVLVHEAQEFDYARRLAIGETYVLRLTARRQHAPERLVVEGAISTPDGIGCARLETVLRLVKAPA